MSTIYIVYILKTSEDTFYVGQTNNLNKRLEIHRKGRGSKYLRMFSGFELVCSFTVASRSSALKLERHLKGLSHAQKAEIVSNPAKYPIVY